MAEERPRGPRPGPAEGSSGREGFVDLVSSEDSFDLYSGVEKETWELESLWCFGAGSEDPAAFEASCGALSRLAKENLKLEKFGCAGAGVFGGGTRPERPCPGSLSCSSLSKPKSKAARGDEEDVPQSGLAALPEIQRRCGSVEKLLIAPKLSAAEYPARLGPCPGGE